ncbi:MAG: S8 family serine peptidase [Clostridia bacterium]
MKKIKIAILDSGVRKDHPAFSTKTINGFSLRLIDESVEQYAEFIDNVGHGTAIFYLIDKFIDNVEITNIKIYDTNSELTQYNFEMLLDFICKNYDFDIINISMGFLSCGSVANLQKICDDFYARRTLIISAFDNNGAVSFPAALNNVIGVDGQENIDSLNGYIHVENSIVNIIGKLKNMRVAWLAPDYIIVKGNSFLCANITANVAKCLQEQGVVDWQKICTDKYLFPKTLDNHIPFNIRKAAVFPFNKELHAIARFEELLNFDIIDYYSIRITGYIGKKISDVLPDCSNDKVIKNIDDIEWNEFDTLILGHTGELSRLTKSDYRTTLLNNAIEKGKNIYCFDNPMPIINNPKYTDVYFPKIDSTNIKKRFGKLYKTDKPIIAVIGTNSRQGKFSLQLCLRKKLIEFGYSVGQIGTEPSALLFGFDEIFHCGYNGQVDLDISQTYIAVNDMIWNITQKDVDLIIAGTQSGFLPYNDYNAMMFPTYHQIFFSALQTDAIIVCINPFDDIQFVNRTIKAAEGLSGGKVIGIVCFPIDVCDSWQGNFGMKARISEERENEIKHKYCSHEDIKVYMLDKSDELDELLSKCIEYFQQ